MSADAFNRMQTKANLEDSRLWTIASWVVIALGFLAAGLYWAVQRNRQRRGWDRMSDHLNQTRRKDR